MFWRKQKVDQSDCPSIDNIGAFVEWTLEHSDDFLDLRNSCHTSTKKFVRDQSANVLQELESLDGEGNLVACIDAGCKEYADSYDEMVDTMGGMNNLPSHIHRKAFALLVKMRVLIQVMHLKYGTALTEPMVSISVPLQKA